VKSIRKSIKLFSFHNIINKTKQYKMSLMDFPRYNSSVLLTILLFILGFALWQWSYWCNLSTTDCDPEITEKLYLASACCFSASAFIILAALYFAWSESRGDYGYSRRSRGGDYD
jgi:ABC-type sulfate transport system permease component